MTRKSGAPTSEVLVVQHAQSEGLGLLAQAIAGHRLSARVVRTFCGEPVPRRAAEARAIVILGGPMGVYESDRFPHLADEIALAADALARDVPILGVCLGSQILAAAAGGRVYRGPEREIGWFPVTLSPEGRIDPVVGALPAETVVFHWHGDTFDLPKGGVLLASSRLYAHQAFRLGRCAYGVQFHPEITPEMVDLWVSLAGEGSAAIGGLEGALRMRSEARRYAPPLEERVAAMARAFFGAG